MRLQAWRSLGKNPCDDPPVKISIGPIGRTHGVVPWVLPLAAAQALFGRMADSITEEPVEITITLQIKEDLQ